MDGQNETDGSRPEGKSAILHLLRERRLALPLIVVPPVLLALYGLGISVWSCPLKGATGCRCPGCGLTRASAALAEGDLSASFALHPFAVAIALAWSLLAVHRLLAEGGRRRLERSIGSVERRFPLSTWLLVGFTVYGIARLVADACGAGGFG